jgi:tRNA modification GTPase
VRRVTLLDPRSGRSVDEALCTVMRAPRSYTGEDTVEISCHGGPALVRMLLERLVEQGARLAEPGEFTRRAFLNGRLDLAQAEAVALMISARTERGVLLAARGLAGELSSRLHDLRRELLDVIASLEAALDFPDDVSEPDWVQTHNILRYLEERSQSLRRAAEAGARTHGGLDVAIVGPPNAGKSSLFNALLGQSRAIVTPMAGTTRDVVEAVLEVGGVPVRLRDTAGIGAPMDEIDAEGMRRAREAAGASDLVVVVLDGSEAPAPTVASILEETRDRARIIVLSKSDLGDSGWRPAGLDAIHASVKTEGGLEALHQQLAEEVEVRTRDDGDEGGIIASLRQVQLLESLSVALGAASQSHAAVPVEIVLVELRTALEAVSALLGVEVGDSVLDALFARFCVGK